MHICSWLSSREQRIVAIRNETSDIWCCTVSFFKLIFSGRIYAMTEMRDDQETISCQTRVPMLL